MKQRGKRKFRRVSALAKLDYYNPAVRRAVKRLGYSYYRKQGRRFVRDKK